MTMFKLEVYNGTQDLTEFYKQAEQRKYYNNSNHNMLIDYIAKHKDSTLILLYFNQQVVGTVVVHSLADLGILGKNAYRIAARTCILTHLITGHRQHTTLRRIKDVPHDHPTSQFLIPACFKLLGNVPMYISTHPGGVGKQNAVHKIFTRVWNDLGLLKNPMELEYKGSFQTFWRVDTDRILETLAPVQWPEAKAALDIFLT
jgi:hypothetical protein